MKKIIGFAGRKRSGKGVLSEHLQSKYDATIITIAEALKGICCDYLNLSLEQLNIEKDKNSVFHINWDDLSKFLSKELNVPYNDIITRVTNVIDLSDGMLVQNNIRELLQIIGTNIIRDINPNWHVDKMVSNIQKATSDIVVVDDVRFTNEKEAIESLGGTVFFVLRPDLSVEISNHSSETGLTWTDFNENRVLINYLTPDLLAQVFDEYMPYDFMLGSDSPMLMSGAHQFGKENPYFAFKPKTKGLDKVMIETLVLPNVANNGSFVIHTTDKSVASWFANNLYKQPPRLENGYYTFVVWNPYIIENLKAWI